MAGWPPLFHAAFHPKNPELFATCSLFRTNKAAIRLAITRQTLHNAPSKFAGAGAVRSIRKGSGMDDNSFDRLTRLLSNAESRRNVARVLLGTVSAEA